MKTQDKQVVENFRIALTECVTHFRKTNDALAFTAFLNSLDPNVLLFLVQSMPLIASDWLQWEMEKGIVTCYVRLDPKGNIISRVEMIEHNTWAVDQSDRGYSVIGAKNEADKMILAAGYALSSGGVTRSTQDSLSLP